MQQQHDAIFQHAFSHLRLYIIYIHKLYLFDATNICITLVLCNAKYLKFILINLLRYLHLIIKANYHYICDINRKIQQTCLLSEKPLQMIAY
ncbi:hypothetical protein BFAG_02167 [Bacteroides fragilis 3_1_12]|uniref:Transmembrane protein n=1 Tax=Bacteroides fragilis 3_1_12 TaxID=457424 RepID=A0ABN0BKN6_BACFG|nr:hypothetical protein BFAG_02167 [Bacteroides fragilis 3_1_12]